MTTRMAVRKPVNVIFIDTEFWYHYNVLFSISHHQTEMQFAAEIIESPSPLRSVMNAKCVSTLPVLAYRPTIYLQTIATAIVPNLSMF